MPIRSGKLDLLLGEGADYELSILTGQDALIASLLDKRTGKVETRAWIPRVIGHSETILRISVPEVRRTKTITRSKKTWVSLKLVGREWTEVESEEAR